MIVDIIFYNFSNDARLAAAGANPLEDLVDPVFEFLLLRVDREELIVFRTLESSRIIVLL